MRVYERHRHREAFVRAADHTDAAVALRDVFHEPVDRVVGVGRVVHLRRVQRPAQRTRHDVFALGLVLAPDVLINPDVAVGREQLVEQRQRRDHVRRPVALRAGCGFVRRPRQQHRRVARALRHDDHRVEPHAVAHRDHHFALHVVVRIGRRGELRGNVGRDGRRLLSRFRQSDGGHGQPADREDFHFFTFGIVSDVQVPAAKAKCRERYTICPTW